MAPQLCSPTALRIAVAVHSFLSARWLLFPLATLAVSGSPVVTMQLAGWFTTLSLTVLLADATALGLWPSMQRAAPEDRYRVLWPMLLVLALALAVAACATLGAVELLAALVLYALLVSCCGCLGARRSGEFALWLYAGWAVAESVFGIGVSFGLRWAAGSLLADNTATSFDVLETQWAFLWSLTVAVYIASWLAALLQLWILALLVYGVRGHSLPLEDGGGGGAGVEERLNVQGLLPPPSDDSSSQQKHRGGSCALFVWSFVALYVVVLAVSTCGFLFHQLWPAGKVFDASTAVSPPCTGCFCHVRLTLPFNLP